MGNDGRVARILRGVASRLAGDPEVQKELWQEMVLHLIRLQVDAPGQTRSWYIQGCKFRARNYLKLGCSIDSPKRAQGAVAGTHDFDEVLDDLHHAHALDFRSQLMANDLAEQIRVRLSDVQQQILDLLMQGHGVREAARELGMSHTAVVKHRQKIACVADALTDRSRDRV